MGTLSTAIWVALFLVHTGYVHTQFAEIMKVNGNSSLKSLRSGVTLTEGDIATDPAGGFDASSNREWTNGVVPYIIKTGEEAKLDAAVTSAAKDYTKHTCVKWVKYANEGAIRRAGIKNYVEFFGTGGGCWSYVGMLGGKQQISIHYPGCTGKGIVIHEMLHALGFWHEQSRMDTAITVVTANIQKGREGNFRKHVSNYYGEKYDIKSIMQYGPFAFSRNGQPTILSKEGIKNFGQRSGLSPSDIRQINAHYECPKKPGPRPTPGPGPRPTAGPGPRPTARPVKACGKPEVSMADMTRVIGGRDANRGSWPWQILLLYKGRQMCGGSIIGDRWVVTAAHCVYGRTFPGSNYAIRAGEHDTRRSEGSEQTVTVKNVIAHPSYNPRTIDNDIALLELSSPVTYNRWVKPACLPSEDVEGKPNQYCYITGWGKVQHPGSMHHTLQQGKLLVPSKRLCNAKNLGRITNSMICGGDGGANKLSGCHGDSGGPFVCNVKGRWELHGAVSWGSGSCDSKRLFTVFSKVLTNMKWILSKTGARPVTPAPPSSRCKVTFYQHSMYRGLHETHSQSSATLKRDNDMSSFKLTSGCCVTIYWYTGYRGINKNFCTSSMFVGWTWNDKASSFKLSSKAGPGGSTPVDGSWGGWGAWTSCSESCGGGQQVRRRECNNPPPKNGGKNCPGIGSESRKCNTQQCPTGPQSSGECGKPTIPARKSTDRVIGGDDAVRGAWPWQILLMYRGRPSCGGTLVSKNWVVTAAHCISGRESQPTSFTVRVGENDRTRNEGSEKDIQVKRIIKHPGYNRPQRLSNDIALLELVQEVAFNNFVKPACLPEREVPVGTYCYITGFGKIKHPGTMHTKLQQGRLQVPSNDKCNSLNFPNTGLRVDDTMICGGDGGVTNLSGCHGDSGGPFVCKVEGRWELHGAVSWGSGRCDSTQTYTVFSRVMKNLSWIKRYVGTVAPPKPKPTGSLVTAPFPGVNCGGHRAPSCQLCPQGKGSTWCNGECSWCSNINQCQVKGDRCQARPVTPAPPSSRCRVTFYQHSQYQGLHETHSRSSATLKRDNDMSSFRLTSGCCVTIYWFTGYRGINKKLCASSMFVGSTWNDKASSFKLYRSTNPPSATAAPKPTAPTKPTRPPQPGSGGTCPMKDTIFAYRNAKIPSGNTFKVTTWQQCAAKCAADSRCFAWSWMNEKYARWGRLKCKLKSRYFVRGKRVLRNVVSGTRMCVGGSGTSAPATVRPRPTQSPATGKPRPTGPLLPPKGQCGVQAHISGKIVGGKNADAGEWPWMVGIYRAGTAVAGRAPFCGGTLIRDNVVVTAAHCLRTTSAASYEVRIGDHNLSRGETGPQEEAVRLSKIYRHENYSPRTTQNDIGLLILNKKVKLGGQVQAACLPTRPAAVDATCYATGWGILKEGGRSQPQILQEVQLPIISQAACKRANGNRVKDDMICAGYFEGGRDSCQGDSGGPLVCKIPGTDRMELHGVTSWGMGCARKNKPGVYSRVNHFVGWINSKLLRHDMEAIENQVNDIESLIKSFKA